MNEEKILDISWATILKISLAVICLYVLFLIRDILIWFIFALIISILVNPVIDFLQRKRVPRIITIVFIYFFGIFGALGLLTYFGIHLLITEFDVLIQAIPHFPHYFERISPALGELGIEAFESPEAFMIALRKMAADIFGVLFAVFGGVMATIFILSVAAFLSLKEKAAEKVIGIISPKKYEAYSLSLWSRCQNKVSGWFLSRILGCLFIGLACYFAFLALGVSHPFSLGLMAGIFNFIPILGPLVSGIIIFIIIALENIFKAIFVLIVFILIQQVENNVLMPILTKKFIDLPPALVLIALAIGGVLWGFLGAILAIPLAGILFEFFKEFLQKKREEEAVVL